MKFVCNLVLNKNVATPADKAEVLSNKDSCILEGPFRDLDLCERVKIRNKKGVIIKLGVPTFINYIGLMLYSKHDEYVNLVPRTLLTFTFNF